jgi:phosphatidylglycerophosphate synthase
LSDLNQETNTPQAEMNISAYVWFAVFSAPELFTNVVSKFLVGPPPVLYALGFVFFWFFSTYTAFRAMKKAGSIEFRPRSIGWLLAILFVVAIAMMCCLRADVSTPAFVAFVLLAISRNVLSATLFNSMLKKDIAKK